MDIIQFRRPCPPRGGVAEADERIPAREPRHQPPGTRGRQLQRAPPLRAVHRYASAHSEPRAAGGGTRTSRERARTPARGNRADAPAPEGSGQETRPPRTCDGRDLGGPRRRGTTTNEGRNGDSANEPRTGWTSLGQEAPRCSSAATRTRHGRPKSLRVAILGCAAHRERQSHEQGVDGTRPAGNRSDPAVGDNATTHRRRSQRRAFLTVLGSTPKRLPITERVSPRARNTAASAAIS